MTRNELLEKLRWVLTRQIRPSVRKYVSGVLSDSSWNHHVPTERQTEICRGIISHETRLEREALEREEYGVVFGKVDAEAL